MTYLSKNQTRILKAIRKSGSTSSEIVARTEGNSETVARRLRELKELGLVENTQKRRANIFGNKEIVVVRAA